MTAPSSRKINVMMVHGTWSAGKWTATDSDFCEALEGHLAAIDLLPVYMAIPWSGKNRWKQRERVTHQLCDSIVRLAHTQRNGHDFLLVAHSHGGNIATDAARRVMKEHPHIPIKGVICMNTPFLTREPRSTTVQYWAWTLVALVLALVAVLPWCFQLSNATAVPWIALAHPQLPQEPWELVTPVAITLVALAGLLVCLSQMAKDTDRLRENDSLEPAPNTLCLSCPDDEAITGLGLLEGIANLPQLMLHGYALLAVTIPIAWLHWQAGQRVFCALRMDCWAQSAATAGLVVSLWLLLSTFLGLAAAFLVSNAFGLRKRDFLDNLVTRVLVSYTPLRPAKAIFRGIRELPGGLRTLFRLSHSRIYEADQTLVEICAWIDHLDKQLSPPAWQSTVREAA